MRRPSGTTPRRTTTTAEASTEAAGERELDDRDFGTTDREDWSNGTEGDDFDGIRELPSNSHRAWRR